MRFAFDRLDSKIKEYLLDKPKFYIEINPEDEKDPDLSELSYSSGTYRFNGSDFLFSLPYDFFYIEISDKGLYQQVSNGFLFCVVVNSENPGKVFFTVKSFIEGATMVEHVVCNLVYNENEKLWYRYASKNRIEKMNNSMNGKSSVNIQTYFMDIVMVALFKMVKKCAFYADLKTNKYIKVKLEEKKTTKILPVIRYLNNSKEIINETYKSGEKITFSHSFSVRGHWRKHLGLGKNRAGERIIENKTWVKSHFKGSGDIHQPFTIIN